MGVSDQIFLFGTLFPDMVRKFWPYCGRFLLASKRNPRCVYGASLCSVTIAIGKKDVQNIFKLNTNSFYYTLIDYLACSLEEGREPSRMEYLKEKIALSE